jgi:hypothetical protein
MYVIEYKRHENLSPDNCLHEMNKREFNLAVESVKGNPRHAFKSVSSQYAHQWVKEGRLHSTGLYTVDGRIRKAQGE